MAGYLPTDVISKTERLEKDKTKLIEKIRKLFNGNFNLREFQNEIRDEKLKHLFFKYKLEHVPEYADYLVESWCSVQVRIVNFSKGSVRTLLKEEFAPAVVVDATTTHGGGLFYCPVARECITYRVNFRKLGLPEVVKETAAFEMLNLIYALFLFKQKIINCKCIRLLTDHSKIRRSKNSGFVKAIHRIFDWMKLERKLVVINNPEGDYNLRIKKDDQIFFKLADIMSRRHWSQSEEIYEKFEDKKISVYELGKDVVHKFRGYF